MSMAFLTSVLYLTMSRSLLRFFHTIKCGGVRAVLDTHKELHIFAALLMVIYAALHTLGHAIGTAPGVITHTVEDLNAVFGCANPDTTPGYLAVDLGPLMVPKCPITKNDYTYMGVIFKTTPGVTGILLWVLLGVMGYTGMAKRRKENFDRFWYVHNAGIVLWPLLLFVHGANGWVGFGFPLVVFTSSLAILAYAFDRIKRVFRYYWFARKHMHIVDTLIRPGKGGAAYGTMVQLQISKPPLWKSHAGMYAFICMPEYAPFQWHPFTISSGKHDPTVDFIISAIGDWTTVLAQKCIDANAGKADLPKVVLDGPYSAPTQSAMKKEILIAVGAGVGITPFLSLLSTAISTIVEHPKQTQMKEAHFFWMTRNMDELLFGRKLFVKIVSIPHLRDKIFLHLHMTAREPDKHGTAFLFRDAIRRQSVVDRRFFKEVFDRSTTAAELLWGPQLPWCWVNGSMLDVMWVGALVDDSAKWQAEVKGTWYGFGRRNRQGGLSLQAKGSLECQETVTRQVSPEGGEVGTTPSTDDKGSWMLPVAFGRPDFAKEVYAIGRARPGHDVHVFICGNDMIVKSLEEVCHLCNDAAKDDTAQNGAPAQSYTMHFERFG